MRHPSGFCCGPANRSPPSRLCSPKRASLGLEGVESKRVSRLYRSGRSLSWLKVKNPNFIRIRPPCPGTTPARRPSPSCARHAATHLWCLTTEQARNHCLTTPRMSLRRATDARASPPPDLPGAVGQQTSCPVYIARGRGSFYAARGPAAIKTAMGQALQFAGRSSHSR